MPERLRLSRAKGWRLPPGAVVVARPTPWGNPFVVGQDGTRAEVVEMYALLLAGLVCLTCKADPGDLEAHLAFARTHRDDLKGHDLACWCALDGPCHADVLLEWAGSEKPDFQRFLRPGAMLEPNDDAPLGVLPPAQVRGPG